MDKLQNRGNNNNKINADNSSASFGEPKKTSKVSINKFLKSLGGAPKTSNKSEDVKGFQQEDVKPLQNNQEPTINTQLQENRKKPVTKTEISGIQQTQVVQQVENATQNTENTENFEDDNVENLNAEAETSSNLASTVDNLSTNDNNFEEGAEVENKFQAALDKFAGKVWTIKPKTIEEDGGLEQGVVDPSQSQGVSDVSVINEAQGQESLVEENQGALTDEVDEGEQNSTIDDAENEQSFDESFEDLDSEQGTSVSENNQPQGNEEAENSGDFEVDEFTKFLQSLESGTLANDGESTANDTTNETNSSNQEESNADVTEEQTPSQGAANESAEQIQTNPAETSTPESERTESEHESEESESQPNKNRRSISKLDYFKYRFLSNSAVGADGSAKVEELATRYGNRRQDNAGIITSSQEGDVEVHYNGEFKKEEINLDFSKRGNAPIYRNSNLLAIMCCVFAFVYAIIGISLYLVFGRVTEEPVVAQRIDVSFDGVIYQEVGTTLDLSTITVTTYYSNETENTTNLTNSMITSIPPILNNNLLVVGESVDEPSTLRFSVNGFSFSVNVWGYAWTADDITVYYYKTGGSSATINADNINQSVLCWVEYRKTVNNVDMSKKTMINLVVGENCEISNNLITSVTIEVGGNEVTINPSLKNIM